MADDDHPGADSERRFGDLPIVEMDSAQRAVNEWLVAYLRPDQASTETVIGGPMHALLRSPQLAELAGRMVPFFFDGLCVPRAVTELVILLTARRWNSDYEFHTHRRYAARFDIEPDVIDAIEAGVRPTLTGELSDVYDFATQLLQDGDVSDAAFARVAARWGRQGAVELVAAVGFYTMLALVLNVDRLPVEVDGRRWRLPATPPSARP